VADRERVAIAPDGGTPDLLYCIDSSIEREQRPDQIELTGIHLNLAEQGMEFKDRHGTVGRLVFGG
jgi:hypothetical protein